jgi:RDD family protein
MNDMRWMDGEVTVEDRVQSARAVSGEALRDGFFDAAATLSLGLIRMIGGSLHVGPFEVLRFDLPATTSHSVSWPIDGGVLAGAPGGYLEVRSTDSQIVARVEGYRPRLPKPVYMVTQLPFHHSLTRLQLLRLRGRKPVPGVPADVSARLAAGAIDAGICAGIALMAARRRRARAFLAITTGYHIAAWAASGWTIGGAIMRQRVVSIDGSRPSFGQAVLRFATLPLAAFRLRAVHDALASTDVITD